MFKDNLDEFNDSREVGETRDSITIVAYQR